MPATKANATARNHFTGMTRSHEKLQARTWSGPAHSCGGGAGHLYHSEPLTRSLRHPLLILWI